MARSTTAAAVERIVHKACEETRRLEETKVFVFNLKVDSLTFDGGALKSLRGLHFAISLKKGSKVGRRILYTPAIKPIVEGSQGHEKCYFNMHYQVDILWEGCDMLTFSVYQQNLFFSSTLLGSCEMPLSLCFEQLVSAAKSCDPTEAGPLPIEVEMNLMYQTKPVLGRCDMFVSCSKEPLGSVGGRAALWATVPEPPGDKQRIHSEAIRLKMLQIHESHSLSRQLQQAQADLWLQGVERLTTEGTLDGNAVNIARACGLVSKERAETLREDKDKARKMLASRSGSFTWIFTDQSNFGFFSSEIDEFQST